MGAIARSAANNITTSGVILPAAINDASVASVTALAQVSAGDGITLISSQTASASASLSFTGIDSTYRTYLFKFINIHAGTDSADFTFNGSTDGGSNYNVTKTTTAFYGYHNEAGSATGLDYVDSHDIAQGTGFCQIGGDAMGIDNDQSCSGTMFLFNPSSTTFVKHFIVTMNTLTEADYNVNEYTAGYCNTTSAVNAVRFQMSSGNIDDGTILMYGIA
jgi:hypothetical protein